MLDKVPHHPRGPFWAKRKRALSTVGEDKHFFLDDIRRIAKGTSKKFNGFKNRRANFFKSIEREKSAGSVFESCKISDIGPEQIACSFGGLQVLTH
jgi:hypothetical protein